MPDTAVTSALRLPVSGTKTVFWWISSFSTDFNSSGKHSNVLPVVVVF